MGIRKLGIAVLLFYAAVMSLVAQDIAPAAVPIAVKDWDIIVQTGGGLTGNGVGGFTLTSTGQFTCDAPNPCKRQIPPAALNEVVAAANSIDPTKWVRVQPPFSLCSDCIMTTMELRIRDTKDNTYTYKFSWDPTTQSSVPSDVTRIYKAAIALQK